MNQVLKDAVYRKGRNSQIQFIGKLGGMDEEEMSVLRFLHEGKTDLFIQQEMSLDKKTYDRIEDSVRAKYMLGVFECINYTMQNLRDP